MTKLDYFIRNNHVQSVETFQITLLKHSNWFCLDPDYIWMAKIYEFWL